MGECMTRLVDKLYETHDLLPEEFSELLKFRNQETADYLFEKAQIVREKYFGNNIYIRGTIELTNYCRNDCYYCGLARSNRFIPRFRLDENDVLLCCRAGYERGVRTFVILGGDDLHFTEKRIAGLLRMVKAEYKDCSVVLSLGERSVSTYREWHAAGASRYLLQHETAGDIHFKKIHPADMSLLRRKQSLWELKEIGYQVGTGFMIGMPFQMVADVVTDLQFLKQLSPEMVHIVPFIPTAHTRFEKERSGNGDMTLYLMAIVRLMLPGVLLTADPALENVMVNGRQKSFSAGVNEVYASLTTDDIKEYFNVYNKKINLRNTSGDDVIRMKDKIIESGFIPKEDIGDYRG